MFPAGSVRECKDAMKRNGKSGEGREGKFTKNLKKKGRIARWCRMRWEKRVSAGKYLLLPFLVKVCVLGKTKFC